jgi:hypothetical protein
MEYLVDKYYICGVRCIWIRWIQLENKQTDGGPGFILPPMHVNSIEIRIERTCNNNLYFHIDSKKIDREEYARGNTIAASSAIDISLVIRVVPRLPERSVCLSFRVSKYKIFYVLFTYLLTH